MTFIQNRPYSGPVQAVVLDWSGTAVDYGSRGPASVSLKEQGFVIYSGKVTALDTFRIGNIEAVGPEDLRALIQAVSGSVYWGNERISKFRNPSKFR